MKISLGTDHAGFRYKEKVKELLGTLGHEVKDFGTFNEEPVDYPLFIRPAAEAVALGECERGIVFGGSGEPPLPTSRSTARHALHAGRRRMVFLARPGQS